VLGALALLTVVVTALVTPATGRQQAVPAAVSTPPVMDATPSPNTLPVGSGGTPSTSNKPSSPSAARAQPTSRAAKRPSKRPSKPAQVASCDPAQLRTTLTGHKQLKTAQSTTFQLSVLNGSPETCLVSVTGHSFLLEIYSGRDRIWSTGDCSTTVPASSQKVAARQAVAWQLPWDGRRSAAGCKSRPETPRAGTYVATAQLVGAKPVRMLMSLHD